MRRPFEPAAYDTAHWPDSHWRPDAPPAAPSLHGAARADVAVIGAGLAGLNAALAAVEHSGLDVAVLDAGQPGWGASGRNAGFACLGGTKLSPAAIRARVGAEGARAADAFRREAVAEVAANLALYGIAADRGPDGEVALAHSAAAWAALGREAAAQAEPGPAPRLIPRAGLRAAGLDGPLWHGAAIEPVGFPLDPMKYLAGLVRAATAAGVRLFGQSPVTALSPEGAGWRLDTPAGSLCASRVLIATNGYSADNLPPWLGRRFVPAISTILVTRPLEASEREAAGWTSALMAFDTRPLLHYFRLLPDRRMLFGMRGALAWTPAALARAEARTRAHFEAAFPALAHAETEKTWSGLVCLTGCRAAFAGPVPEAAGLYAAFGWHGGGVSMATLAGRRLGAEIAGAPAAIPTLFRRPPARVPIPRRLALGAAYAGYALAGRAAIT